jgi:hypothetical protein
LRTGSANLPALGAAGRFERYLTVEQVEAGFAVLVQAA